MAPSKNNTGKSTDRGGRANHNTDKRVPKESARKRDQHERDAELAAQRADKRQQTRSCRNQRLQTREEDLLVRQDNETDRETELRRMTADQQTMSDELKAEMAQLRAMIERRDRYDIKSSPGRSSFKSRTKEPRSTPAPPTIKSTTSLESNDLVPRPEHMSQMTMSRVREYMDLLDSPRWLQIKAQIRDFMCLASVDLNVSWKRQNKSRLGGLYTLAEEHIPELKIFEAGWATEFIIQDVFNHRRTYANKKRQEVKDAIRGETKSDDSNEEPSGGRRTTLSSRSHPHSRPQSPPPPESRSPTPIPDTSSLSQRRIRIRVRSPTLGRPSPIRSAPNSPSSTLGKQHTPTGSRQSKNTEAGTSSSDDNIGTGKAGGREAGDRRAKGAGKGKWASKKWKSREILTS